MKEKVYLDSTIPSYYFDKRKPLTVFYGNLGEKLSLNYLRTKDGKEIDFCLCKNDKIVEAIEVKNKRLNISKNLLYFCKKYSVKGIQVVKDIKNERSIGNIDIRIAENYLKELFL